MCTYLLPMYALLDSSMTERSYPSQILIRVLAMAAPKPLC